MFDSQNLCLKNRNKIPRWQTVHEVRPIDTGSEPSFMPRAVRVPLHYCAQVVVPAICITSRSSGGIPYAISNILNGVVFIVPVIVLSSATTSAGPWYPAIAPWATRRMPLMKVLEIKPFHAPESQGFPKCDIYYLVKNMADVLSESIDNFISLHHSPSTCTT